MFLGDHSAAGGTADNAADAGRRHDICLPAAGAAGHDTDARSAAGASPTGATTDHPAADAR